MPLSLALRQAGFTISMLLGITISVFHNVAMMALALYFLRRNGEALSTIGLNPANRYREIVRGLVLFFPILIFMGLLAQLLRFAGLPITPNPMQTVIAELGRFEIIGMIGLMVIIAIAEEIVFRGYLIQRLQLISGSSQTAVILSSVLFALGHGYQGPIALVVIFVLGMILGGIFVLTRSLIAPMTIHFLNNSLAIIIWSIIEGGDYIPS